MKHSTNEVSFIVSIYCAFHSKSNLGKRGDPTATQNTRRWELPKAFYQQASNLWSSVDVLTGDFLSVFVIYSYSLLPVERTGTTLHCGGRTVFYGLYPASPCRTLKPSQTGRCIGKQSPRCYAPANLEYLSCQSTVSFVARTSSSLAQRVLDDRRWSTTDAQIPRQSTLPETVERPMRRWAMRPKFESSPYRSSRYLEAQ